MKKVEAATVIGEPSALLQSERLNRTVPRVTSKTPLAVDFEAEPEVPDDVRAEMEEWSAPYSKPVSSYVGLVVDGRYLIESCIAQGGMSVVYRCRHIVIGKSLAMKIISADLLNAPEAPERSLLEAKAASAIGNEHIIDIVDCGTLPDGSPYLVMELLQGKPLSALIEARERMSLSRILSIVLQVAEGLSAAHEAGIVHRDLKPENIFIVRRKSGDFVKILDFGVAKMLRSNGRRLTRAGCVVGTPHYMAPEQATGASIDQRGDIYALGVILYELATGRVPFDGAHYLDVLTKHLTEPPPPFEASGSTSAVPAEYEQIVQRCMAKRPEERFQTAGELAVQLQLLLTPSPEPRAESRAAPPISNGSLPCAPSQNVAAPPKHKQRSLLAFGAVVLLLSFGSLWHLRRAALPEETSRAAAPLPSAAAPAQPVVAEPVALPAPPADPVTVVQLGPGKTVEIEARTRLSLRVDETNAPPDLTPHSPTPAPAAPVRQARPKQVAPLAPSQSPATEARAADELINPWPAAP
jgi:eukaryotic-like serine/threonine-protein kinase